jgi:hypothetical protein
LSTLWNKLDPKSNPDPKDFDIGDPRIVFDPNTQHWITIALGYIFDSTNACLLIAVSKSSDPTESWDIYRIDAKSTPLRSFDFPYLGFNKNWIAISVTMVEVRDGVPQNSDRHRIYTLELADFTSGGSGKYSFFEGPTTDFYGSVPAETYDSTIAPLFLVRSLSGRATDAQGNPKGKLRVFRIEGTPSSPRLAGLNDEILLQETWADSAPFRNFAPQKGAQEKMDTGGSYVHGAVLRNGFIWFVQTVYLPADAPKRSSIQWAQIGTNLHIQQVGRIDDPSGRRFYAFPSLAVNQAGDLMVGYSRFSADSFTSAGYSVHAHGDPLGSTRSERVYKAGEGPYVFLFDEDCSVNHWGDYSATVIDPKNGLDFWTLQSFADTPTQGRGRWGTFWGKVEAKQLQQP